MDGDDIDREIAIVVLQNCGVISKIVIVTKMHCVYGFSLAMGEAVSIAARSAF